MKSYRFLVSAVLAGQMLSCMALAYPDVVINEFMAVNDSTYQDRYGDYADWIELYNNASNTVSLNGWYLTDRAGDLAKWRFPDVSIGARGYMVVFASGRNEADPTTELHTSFGLSGGGEYLGLVSNDGVTVVSEYAPEYPPQAGDYSFGRHTPTSTVALGPQMFQATASTTGVTTTSSITITVRVDRTLYDISTVQVKYRVMYQPEQTLLLKDDGIGADAVADDDIYSATLAPTNLLQGQMLRWRYEAIDDHAQITLLPRFDDPLDSARYFGTVVTDTSIVSHLPVVHWFIETPAGADTREGTNSAVWFLDRFYDNVRFSLHGATTTDFDKKSDNVDFTRDHRFTYAEGRTKLKDVDLLTNWDDKSKLRNTLAYNLQAYGGGLANFCFPVRIQQNGAFFSVASMTEDIDDRYLERLDLDGDGVLYKMGNGMTSSTLNVDKKTRLDEDNSDLQALIDGLGATGKPGYMYDHVNIPSVVNYLAGHVITFNTDHGHKNFCLYQDTDDNGDWMILVWDLNLSFGHRWDPQLGNLSDTIHTVGGLIPSHNPPLYLAVLNTPETRAMFLRRIRTLMDETLTPQGTPFAERYFEPMISYWVETIDPEPGVSDADLDYAKWGSWGNMDEMRAGVGRITNEYFVGRRDYLYNGASVTNGGEIPLAQPLDAEVQIAKITVTELDDGSRWPLSGAAVDTGGGHAPALFTAGVLVSSGGCLSQTFTIDKACTLSRIDVAYSTAHTDGTIQLRLQVADVSLNDNQTAYVYGEGENLFTTQDLAFRCTTEQKTPGVLSLEFTAADRVTLQAGKTYAIEFINPGTSRSSLVLRRRGAATYAHGAAFVDRTSLNGTNTRDVAMRIFSVEQPGTDTPAMAAVPAAVPTARTAAPPSKTTSAPPPIAMADGKGYIVRLDDFANDPAEWKFFNGTEFPGASGALAVIEDASETGKPMLKLTGDFTGGGKYVATTKALTMPGGHDLAAIRLRARTDDVQQITVRLGDGSGQVHQKKNVQLTPDDQWHDLVLRVDDIVGIEHWGGAPMTASGRALPRCCPSTSASHRIPTTNNWNWSLPTFTLKP